MCGKSDIVYNYYFKTQCLGSYPRTLVSKTGIANALAYTENRV